MTDGELRQALLEHGPGWIRDQAVWYGAHAQAFLPPVAEALRPFFAGDVDKARVIRAAIENPPFYAELLARGADPAQLLDFAAGVDSVTFISTIIVGTHAAAPAPLPLLFHELVHVVQYRLLGVEEFAARYVDGWLSGRVLYGHDPRLRYVNIPLEAIAYEVQRWYEAAPWATFAVAPIVRQRLGL